MMIKRFINWFFSDNDEIKRPYKIVCYDKQDNEYSLIELLQQLTQHLIKIEERVKVLEEENVNTTNELYRMENSLDARIDILAEHCRINTDV